MPRVKIGLIGCSMVVQVMHLPHLTELNDRSEIVAAAREDTRLMIDKVRAGLLSRSVL